MMSWAFLFLIFAILFAIVRRFRNTPLPLDQRVPLNQISVVITGSSKGIGFGLAKEFLKCGVRGVTLSGRNQKVLAQAHHELSSAFGSERVASTACDVVSEDDLQQLYATALRNFGRVDVWINNAGVTTAFGSVWDLNASDMARTVSTNLTGTLLGCKTAIRNHLALGTATSRGLDLYLLEGFGSNGRAMRGLSVYACTKRALTYLTKALCVELASDPAIPRGSVHVRRIQPGMVHTELTASAPGMPARFDFVKHHLGQKVEPVAQYLVHAMLRGRCAEGGLLSAERKWGVVTMLAAMLWRSVTRRGWDVE
eukprot:gnl/Trimastix_PCT/2354.p1 GENE.gnl/Trimastix_PCT/2354~~gnl/Trimastix_PCT/2354.p1  ORF type:complete len:311 (+),score=38.47 gnl/Trimastix_PCT/2354:77-1009(+)